MIRLWTKPGTVVSLLGTLLAVGCTDGTPPVLGDVTLTDPPSARAPLAARLTLTTDEPAVVTLAVTDSTREWSVTPEVEPGVDH